MFKDLNVALVAMRGGLAYDVLRALHAMGARVQLICDSRSSIRMSRYSDTIHICKDISSEPSDRIRQIINEWHDVRPIDLVLASDVEGEMLLNRIRAELIPPIFPAPDNPTLALLNNKWSFYQLCTEIGISAPDSIYFDSKQQLDVARIETQIGYPAVVKPVAMSGGDGVIVADNREAVSTRVIADRRYGFGRSGLIVQRYVKGQDWGYIALADEGRVKFALTFVCGPNWRTEFQVNPDLLNAAKRIVQHVGYTGVVNFDCRFDKETKVFKFLECNPRFCRRITASRLCGVNFVRAGLGGEEKLATEICYLPIRDVFTREGAMSLVQGRWPLSVVAGSILEGLSDPIPAFVQNAGWARVAQSALSPLLQRLLPSRL